MSSNNCIIPECYVDSCLIEVLLYANREHVNHQKGNGTVAHEMKNKFANDFCIGIIDEDRKQLDYLAEFNLEINANDLKLWKHRFWPQYMIQICPVMEDWILSISSQIGVNLQDYGLPEAMIDLKKVTKSVASKTDQRFIQLFKDLVKKESKSAIKLKNWLEYLKANKYNADINQLNNG
jgi:hypothetical protein